MTDRNGQNTVKTYRGTKVNLVQVDARIAAEATDAMQRIAAAVGSRLALPDPTHAPRNG